MGVRRQRGRLIEVFLDFPDVFVDGRDAGDADALVVPLRMTERRVVLDPLFDDVLRKVPLVFDDPVVEDDLDCDSVGTDEPLVPETSEKIHLDVVFVVRGPLRHRHGILRHPISMFVLSRDC